MRGRRVAGTRTATTTFAGLVTVAANLGLAATAPA